MTRLKIVILLISFCIISVSSQIRITTDFKDYRQEFFKLNNINHLNVIGKHAEINLQNWDKDSINVETTIEILSDKPNLSKELLEEIEIRIVQYQNSLLVKTNLDPDFSSTIPYKIIYNIFFPKKLRLSLENSHGSVKIAEVQGGTNAVLSYCDITINNLNTLNDSVKNSLLLSYCKGTLNLIGSSELNINNSELKIIEAKNININSEYSNLKIQKTNNLNGNSNIDNLKLGEVGKIKLQAFNSSIELDNFRDSALFECKKGQLKILNSPEHFKLLTVNNKNTKTKIHLNSNASYTINGEIYNGSILHPRINRLKIIKENNKSSFSGDIGVKPESESKVIIFNTNQNIEFK